LVRTVRFALVFTLALLSLYPGSIAFPSSFDLADIHFQITVFSSFLDYLWLIHHHIRGVLCFPLFEASLTYTFRLLASLSFSHAGCRYLGGYCVSFLLLTSLTYALRLLFLFFFWNTLSLAHLHYLRGVSCFLLFMTSLTYTLRLPTLLFFLSLKVYYLFLSFSGSDSGGRSAHCTLRIADRSVSFIFTSSSQKDAFCTPLTFSYVNIVTVLRKSLLCHYTFRKDAFVPGKQFWDESFTYCTLCLADLDFSFSIVSSLSQSSHHFLITNLSQHTSKIFSFLLHGSEREVGVSTSLNRSPPQKNKFLE
jgi:hypothetical protein